MPIACVLFLLCFVGSQRNINDPLNTKNSLTKENPESSELLLTNHFDNNYFFSKFYFLHDAILCNFSVKITIFCDNLYQYSHDVLNRY